MCWIIYFPDFLCGQVALHKRPKWRTHPLLSVIRFVHRAKQGLKNGGLMTKMYASSAASAISSSSSQKSGQNGWFMTLKIEEHLFSIMAFQRSGKRVEISENLQELLEPQKSILKKLKTVSRQRTNWTQKRTLQKRLNKLICLSEHSEEERILEKFVFGNKLLCCPDIVVVLVMHDSLVSLKLVK